MTTRASEHEANLPVAQQPDPMLREGRAHPLKIAAVLGGATLVVVLVFYGLTRPERDQVATAPTEAPAAQSQSTAAPAPPNDAKAAPKAAANQDTQKNSPQPPETTGQATPPQNPPAQPQPAPSAPAPKR